jgi:hypothetical protein
MSAGSTTSAAGTVAAPVTVRLSVLAEGDLGVVEELGVLAGDVDLVALLGQLVGGHELGGDVGEDVDLDAGVLAAGGLGDEEVAVPCRW